MVASNTAPDAPDAPVPENATGQAAERLSPASGDAAPAKQTTGKRTGKRAAAAADGKTADRKTGARKVAAKKSSTDSSPTAVPLARASAPVDPADLAVRAGEEPWSAEEVDEARAKLTAEADKLQEEIVSAEKALTGLMRDSGDGAGDDQADTGSKNATREHELALAGNSREVLYQTQRALARLEAGTYGLCESCGNPIGKARMQAFPRATLCVDCKQRQERRF
ncbi:TraR/DksA family transcriptional regulator [Streptomyces sp. 7-21]|jgi:DnaK suppressor protein|nr:TraR/DksA family transcriptional regulator [Streptomyces sp. 7-21]